MSGQQITNGTTFECNNVTYGEPTINKSGGKAVKVMSNGSSLLLSTHSMLTWGMQEYIDESSGRKSYSMSLQFEDDEQSKQFLENLKAFESKLKADCVKYCKKWMNKGSLSPEVADALFHPILNYPKDKNTGEPDYDRNPTIKIKMDCWDDKFTFEIYDVKGDPLFQPGTKEDIHPLELITKLSKVMTIIRCGGLWFANGKFGCTWRLVQSVVKPRETLTGKCHIHISKDDIKQMEEQQEKTKDMDEVVEKIHNTVIADSDDEDTPDAESVPEPEPKPEPEPETKTETKKKVIRKKKTAE